MRTPSMNTAVKRPSAPRRYTLVVAAGPPLRLTVTPGMRSSTSDTEAAPMRSIENRSTTVTSATTSVMGISERVAETTTVGSEVWARAGKAMAHASGSTARRAGSTRKYMKKTDLKIALAVFPDSSWALRRRSPSGRTTTLLAGIRAGRATPITFPVGRGLPVAARWERSCPSIRAPRLLTVAGAAQVRSVRCGLSLLLPVELRHANHTASTNAGNCKPGLLSATLQSITYPVSPCPIPRNLN